MKQFEIFQTIKELKTVVKILVKLVENLRAQFTYL